MFYMGLYYFYIIVCMVYKKLVGKEMKIKDVTGIYWYPDFNEGSI